MTLVGIAIKKKTGCASCEEDYQFLWSSKRQWCSHCEVYVCKKCTPDKKCPRCENPITERLTNTFSAVLIILLFSSAVFGMTLFLNISDLSTSSLEVGDISGLDERESVKIFGIINSTGEVAIKGAYEGEDSSWLWMPQNFYVEDDTGTIWVDTSHYWLTRTNNIKPGSHPQKQYWDGDEICIIGTVQNHTTRGLTIEAEYIAQNPDEFRGLDVFWVYIFGLITVFFTLLALYLGADLLYRKRQHIENFANFSPKKIKEKEPTKASIMGLRQKKWRRKARKEKWTAFNYSTALKTGVFALFVFFGMIIFVVIMLMSAIGSPVNEMNWADICLCSSGLTLAIAGILSLLAAYGYKQQIGEYTLKYTGDKEGVDFKEIEEKFTKIVDDFDLPYSKDKKEVYKGSWSVTYEIPGRCGNISYTYVETLVDFTFTIKVGKGVREDNEYKEQVRAAIERVFDECFNVGER